MDDSDWIVLGVEKRFKASDWIIPGVESDSKLGRIRIRSGCCGQLAASMRKRLLICFLMEGILQFLGS
jgi:hypothetical protein